MTNVNTPILSLPPTVGSLAGDEYVPIVQGGTTKKTQVSNFVFNSDPVSTRLFAITYVFPPLATPISTSFIGYSVVPVDCTVVSATLVSDQQGDLTVQVWKCTGAQFNPPATPSVANIVSGTQPMVISGTPYYYSTSTSWVSSWAGGDIVAFAVDDSDAIASATVSILCQPSS